MIDTYVLYHRGCHDGFGAAWAAWKVFGDQARYIPVQYGGRMPATLMGADVYILDMSYPRDELVALKRRCRELLVLDHHQSAEAELAGLEFAKFDRGRSGCEMAWRHFHPDQPVPLVLEHIEDRDLWKFDLEDTRAVSAALQLEGWDFKAWDHFINAYERGERQSILACGRAVMRFITLQAESLAAKAGTREVGGYQVPTCNVACGALISETGHALLERYPLEKFSATYFEKPGGEQVWSLRGRGDFDVSIVAQRFGGGGHRSAAGFRLPPQAAGEVAKAVTR